MSTTININITVTVPASETYNGNVFNVTVNVPSDVPTGDTFKVTLLSDGNTVTSERGIDQSAADPGIQDVTQDIIDSRRMYFAQEHAQEEDETDSIFGDEIEEDEEKEVTIPVKPKKGYESGPFPLGSHLTGHPLFIVGESPNYDRSDWDEEYFRLGKYHLASYGFYLVSDGHDEFYFGVNKNNVENPYKRVIVRYLIGCCARTCHMSAYVDLKMASEMNRQTLRAFLKKYEIDEKHFHRYLRHYKQTNRL